VIEDITEREVGLIVSRGEEDIRINGEGTNGPGIDDEMGWGR
jgi:hypothetical protein